MKKSKFCIVAIFLSSILAISCSNGFATKGDGKAYIRINSEIAARTIIPDEVFINEISKLHDFELEYYSYPAYSESERNYKTFADYSELKNFTLELDSYGDWAFILTARSEHGVVFRDDSNLRFNVKPGMNNISFRLAFYELTTEATGGMDFYLYFPPEVNAFTFELSQATGNNPSSLDCAPYVTFGEGTGDYAGKKFIHYEQHDIPSEPYDLYINLFADEEKKIQVCDYFEKVAIADNITCRAVRETSITELYKIEYEFDGGEMAPGTSLPYCYTRYYRGGLRVSNPQKDGCRFDGWYTSLGEDGKELINGSIPSDSYGDITLYAKWIKDEVRNYLNFKLQSLDDEEQYTNGGGKFVTGYAGDEYTEEIKAPEGFTRRDNEPLYFGTSWGDNINVYFNRNSYTSTFDFGLGSDPVQVSTKYGAEITIPEAPEREGYYLASSWVLKDNPDKSVSIDKQTTEENTYLAVWKKHGYRVNYSYVDYNDRDQTSYKYVYYDDPITFLPKAEQMKKKGYTFVTWDPAVPEKMPAHDMEFTPVWKKNSYTITFDTNGGTEIEPITVEYGDSIPEIQAPEKKGYVFDGWFGIGDESSRFYYISETKFTENITFTAEWKEGSDTPFKVEHYWQNIEDDEYTWYETTDEKGRTNSNVSDYRHYYTGFDCSSYSSNSEIINADGSTVIKRYYDRKKYELRGNYSTYIEVKYGAKLPAPTKLRAGYNFAGWYTSSNEPAPETMPAANLSDLRATWTPRNDTPYKVIHRRNYQSDEFKVDDEVEWFTGTTDSEITVTPKTYEHYTYSPSSWVSTINGDGSTEVTLYYRPVSYTINYEINENETKSIFYKYGASVSGYDVDEKIGYTFKGWEPALPEYMPGHDLTVKAVWAPRTDTQYWVGYYLEDLDGTYDEKGGSIYKGTTGELTDFKSPKTFEGFTMQPYDQVIITPFNKWDDNMACLNIYYTRNTYTLSFDTDGGEEMAPLELKYGEELSFNRYNTGIYIKPPTKESDRYTYEFIRWDNKPENDRMPAENITLKAIWAENKISVIMPVEVYRETEIEGEYKLYERFKGYDSRFSNKGYVGELTNVPDEPYRFTNYKMHHFEQQVIQADTVIKIYYDRKSYTYTFNTDGGSEIPPIEFRYDCQLPTPATSIKQGYEFRYWYFIDDDGKMYSREAEYGFWNTPIRNEDLVITLSWRAASNTPYTVNYWLQDLDDKTHYTLMYTEHETGTTGQLTPRSIEHSLGKLVEWDQKEIAPDGSTVQNIKFNRLDVDFEFYNEKNELLYTLTGKSGAPVEKPADPVKQGYDFDGWSPELPEVYPVTEYAEKFYSTWKPAEVEYTVNFYTPIYNSSEYKLYKTEKRKGYTESNANVKPIEIEGFTYSSSKSSNGKVIKADGSTVIEMKYDRDYKIMTFYNAEGKVHTTQKYYFEGQAVTVQNPPSKTGYTFAGWEPEIPATYPGKDMEFYPVFTPENISYKVIHKYQSTEGVTYNTEQESLSGKYGELTKAVAKEKTGFTAKPFEQIVISTNSSQAVEIIYLRNTYTITFDTDEGSEIEPITGRYEKAITKPANPTRAGYIFKGWDKEIPSKMPASDMLITALWEARTDTPYTVEYYHENIEDKEYTKVHSENKTGTTDTQTAAELKSYEGFTAQPITQMNINGDGSTVVKVYYTRNQYTITFDTDGGTAVASITGKHGAAITAPAEPTKEGYFFMGWDTEVPATMPVGDTTVTARWHKKTAVSVITLTPQPEVAITAEGFTLTADDGYSLYKWYVDGKLVQKSESNVYRFTRTAKGSYRVMVIVYDSENNPYSTTVQIDVQ